MNDYEIVKDAPYLGRCTAGNKVKISSSIIGIEPLFSYVLAHEQAHASSKVDRPLCFVSGIFVLLGALVIAGDFAAGVFFMTIGLLARWLIEIMADNKARQAIGELNFRRAQQQIRERAIPFTLSWYWYAACTLVSIRLKEGILRGVRGRTRLTWLRRHRLDIFEMTFDKYLRHEVSAEVVAERGRKLLAAARGR
jgi:hypothetical protein